MHIENGIIDSVRLVAANAAAASLIASQIPALLRIPATLVKSLLAAGVFSLLMQIWHLPVGPSELHLIGATTVYLLFGLPATLLGFGLGLLVQALVFEPADLLHLGVNALSLGVPLVAMHLTVGRRLFAVEGQERFTLARVLRLDAVYYGGVVTMVGFWLAISNDPAPIADWAAWAGAYGPVVLIEAIMTFAAVTLLRRRTANPTVVHYTEVARLRFAD